MKPSYFVFDLDDTLMYEIDYLKSAYNEIALELGHENLYPQMLNWYKDGTDVFEIIAHKFNIKKSNLIQSYRNHLPEIQLRKDTEELLRKIKANGHYLGLITDGRSVTQRNKLKALGIESIFNQIIISEEYGSAKPEARNYEAFLGNHSSDYYYIGDNVKKDFVTPNALGWKTICLLDKGQNIHKQNFDMPHEYLPQHIITDLAKLTFFVK